MARLGDSVELPKTTPAKKGILGLLSLRNIILALTAAHLIRKILAAARRSVALRFLV